MDSSQAIRPPAPPRGWKALPWRMPVWLYRLGLGACLGRRFLLLEHLGRKTGRRRQNVLEVLHYDPEGRVFYVASGFGRRAHWFRNIQAHPQVTVQVGRTRYRALARVLDVAQGARMLMEYAHAHPVAFRVLARLLGIPVPRTLEDFRRLAEAIPVVAFEVYTSATATREHRDAG